MIAALLLAVACVPTPEWSPTPVVKWDWPGCKGATSVACWQKPVPKGEDCAPGCYVETAGKVLGHILRWQRPGVPFDETRKMTFPCWEDQDGRWICPGRDFGYPVQRLNGSELEQINFVVSAYNAVGEGPPSNVLTICMPKLCKGVGPCD